MLNKLLQNAQSIALGGHVRPDGDCVGSSLGLFQYIRNNYPEKQVDLYLEEIPESINILKGTEQIKHSIPDDKVYDLFICLDCGDIRRLGFSAPLFESAKNTLCIDHHVSNEGFAKENYVFPNASSTSELVYQLIDKDKIDIRIAEDLFLGITHDTGVFQFSCTAPSTHIMASELLKKGIDAANLIEETYHEKTFAQNKVMGQALLDSYLLNDGKVIASYIDEKTMKKYNTNSKEMEGIVNQLRYTKGVETAIFLYELEPNVYKVSLRSGNLVDVSIIAKKHGGGGHKKAAGVSFTGDPKEIIRILSADIGEQLNAAQ